MRPRFFCDVAWVYMRAAQYGDRASRLDWIFEQVPRDTGGPQDHTNMSILHSGGGGFQKA